MKTTAVAVDGPVGAGKSTLARDCAKQLGYIYVDTGALYRAVGLYCKRAGTDISDPSQTNTALAAIKLEIKLIDSVQHIYLNHEDVSDEIRLPEISMMASAVSAIPAVRTFLLDLQRDMAKRNNVIMDGRDIGTVVLPNAEVKIFITAKPEIRAKRRYDELVTKGVETTFDSVLDDLNKRDWNDSHRDIAPLRQAEDAILLDTGDMTYEQSKQAMLALIGGNGNDR